MQGRHDAKVSTAATNCPEQLFFIVATCDNDASIRQHDLRGDHIVEGKPEAADQGAVPTAQRESREPNRTDGPRHRRDAEWISHGDNI
jgi:hypothetical protein